MENETNKNTKFKDILKELGIIFLYIILNIILVLVFYKGINSKNPLISNSANILVELIVLVVFIIIFRKSLIPDFYDFKKNGKKYIKDNFKYYLMGLGIMMISNILISSFIDLPKNELLIRELFKNMLLYYVVATIIVAPIVEELMVRKILKDTFKHHVIYYIISALIFGSLHLISLSSIYELFYLIPYGALGYFLAVIYDKSNNIWTNIFFHSLHNLIATLLMLISI